MTEEEIERQVEAMTDALDRRYLTTAMPEAVYRVALADIDQWAERQRQFSPRP